MAKWTLRGHPDFIVPGSEEHARAISPSKIASICNISRWESAYTLWHRMKGLIDPKPHQDSFDVGTAMEAAMAELWKIQHPGWRLSPCEVQFSTDEFGFPALATIDRRASRGKSQRIVEMKIARDMHEQELWGDPDLAGDAPADYVLQVIAQQLLTGLHSTADLLVLGPFYKERIYRVEFDQKIADWMLTECRQFYDSLAADEPPPLDDSVSTYESVRELHPDIDGTEAEVPLDLVVQIRELKQEVDSVNDKLRMAKTELLDIMGDAQRATVEGIPVARRQPHGRGGVALVML